MSTISSMSALQWEVSTLISFAGRIRQRVILSSPTIGFPSSDSVCLPMHGSFVSSLPEALS